MMLRASVISLDSDDHELTVELQEGPAVELTLPILESCPQYHYDTGDDVLVWLWPDVGGVVLGPYGDTPGSAEIPGDLQVEGDLEVQGLLRGEPSTLTRYWQTKVGERAISDDTLTDIITFTKGTASYSSSRGLCTGLLFVSVNGRSSGGSWRLCSRVYLLTIYSLGTLNMVVDLQQLGSDNEQIGGAITLTVQQKSGTSSTSLTLEAKATWSGFGTGSQIAAHFVGHSHATTSAHIIVPAIT